MLLGIDTNEKNKWKQYLSDNCEPFNWDWTYNPRVNHIDNGFSMGSMLGKCKIIDTSINQDKNIKVLFSGIGADEVMSHNSYYSCGYGNVNIFPEDL